MQIGYINIAKRKTAVLLQPSDFLKAGNYAVAKEKMSIISSFVDYLFFIAFLWSSGIYSCFCDRPTSCQSPKQ